MKTTQSVALVPQKGAAPSREKLLLLLLKMRTFIALFLIVGFFTMTVPGFLSAGSLVIMIKHIAINAFLALGITFVIITAGIDLSIGATLGLCGMIAGWMITKGIVLPMFGIAIFPSVWVIVPVVLLIGALIGAVNGWIITRYNVAPFICTLGTMYVLRGASMLTSDGQTFPGLSGNPQLGNTGFDEIGAGTLLGIPWAIWMMIVLALVIAYIAPAACRLAATFMPLVITSAPPSFPGCGSSKLKCWSIPCRASAPPSPGLWSPRNCWQATRPTAPRLR